MNRHRLFAIGASAVVAASVIAGLVFIGSPAEERLRRIDRQRVDHLNGIAHAIRLYHQAHDSLPDRLARLEADPVRASIPVDPLNGEAYRYEAVAQNRYRLCATFARENTGGAVVQGRFSAHAAGEDCFEVDVTQETWRVPVEMPRRPAPTGVN